MQNHQHKKSYLENGYLLIEDFIESSTLSKLHSEMPKLFQETGPHVVREKNTDVVRAIHGSHKTNELMKEFVQDEEIVSFVKEILEDDVYVHQFKINSKAGFGGDVWPWHQDHIFWMKDDGIMEPDFVNVCIFLDDVTEFNAPLFLIPKTHHLGTLNVPSKDGVKDSNYLASLSADLKYTIDLNTVREQVSLNGIFSAKGKAGTVLFFHSNVFHGSGYNMSPFDRRIMIISYNTVSNLPLKLGNRPEFLCSSDFTPIQPLQRVRC